MKKAGTLTRLKKYDEAFELLKAANRDGDPMASYALGTWYLHGTHVKKDLKKGVYYLTKASKGNIKEAFFDLAICYEKGSGTEKNLQKAFQFYSKASNLGDKDALYEIVRCFYYGIGVEKSKDFAALIYNKVFNLGKDPVFSGTSKRSLRTRNSRKLEYA